MSDSCASSEWVPLLVPDMPSPQELTPWLERMHAARHYSNYGPLVRELESEFAQRFALPVDDLTTVSNATQGLELVLQALELAPGSRILLPAFTFVATATAVVRAGHLPVLADVDPDDWMLTPDIARAACAVTPVDAVLPVATFGMPHDMKAWQQFEQDTGLPVVIDAAAAYGSQWLQGAEGTLVFSLHTTKSLPAGEGGLVVSTRTGLAARVRQLSNFGINLDPKAGMPLGSLARVGTNAKMSEYHAAIGLASLQVWEEHALERRRLHACLMEELDEASGHSLVWQRLGAGGALAAPSLLCAQLPDDGTRRALEQTCQQMHITTRRWYQPLLQHMQALLPHCQALETPHADRLASTLVGLPFFLGMEAMQRGRLKLAVSAAVKASRA
ncbi:MULTISPECIES: DegT/DnrJ/EryC1/StrS family aminotransferase [Delftia]|jgi:dTDP-4-amino-4,6-dideoxygalactose transaminase|uniref:DegT/DnrJ/EryC1/StrS family aminotransferase n=1 Tax=Delftia TaxID=80865 RepID=UPI00193BBC88|nr:MULTISPECIES: DegT/DnrJ/EryC1/StrS family aminotransferase [Delftia]MCO5339398.1 DegT/DnrJ/EryC1/StrS family aminotransferase [Delftia tsuruhatensis]MCR4547020.1 DegT/DnrJ/EryC1/StrS family aminotransferase [Delftia tsuruhatensis]QRI91095.1 DegT/DnrJ/EryC1/StrS family aminotransferase [Delftia lacustris]